MKTLAIETSNQTLSVAVVENHQLLGVYTTTVKKTHGETLMPAIEQLLKNLEIKPSEIDRFAVAQGPGSYTGLRIGVTTAKTLAFTLDKELVGLSSLKILAGNIERTDAILCPLFDARRQQVFIGAYQWVAGTLQVIKEDCHTDFVAWLKELESLNQPIIFVGQDVQHFTALIESDFRGDYEVASALENVPNAAVLGLLSETEPAASIPDFVPNYLRLTEAEVNWHAAHPNAENEDYVEKY